MKYYEIKNELLTVAISSMGAELRSIKDNYTDQEYLWNAQPRYWKRSAPVLFPLVGNFKDKTFRYGGKEYRMDQHGFARDKEFQVETINAKEIWFVLESDEETRAVYPFDFRLHIGYCLHGRSVYVYWRVENPSDRELYFSIGGHPAFFCPIEPKAKQTDYSIAFDTCKDIICSVLNEDGTIKKERKIIQLVGGTLPITEHMFDGDALVFENTQIHRVSLMRMDKTPYVTVEFDAPVVGIWSPAGEQAPFVCIEPWYGRADREDFTGDLSEREWGNTLRPGETFEKEYRMTFL